MEYRLLGRTGVQVSPLCLGCMMFGGNTSEDDSMPILHEAMEKGINFLDTADIYHRGLSEKAVGRALKEARNRDRIFLASKCWGRMSDEDPNMAGTSRRHVIAACEASLKRLQVDYLDLFQIHRPNPEVPFDETLRALDDLVRAGKVRYIGSSTFAAWQVVEGLWMSKELGLNRVISEQPPYHLLDRRIERELVPMAQTYGLALLPWSPLAGGLLTGKYSRDQEAPEGSRMALPHVKKSWELISGKEAIFDVVDVVNALADEKGCTAAQLALAWTLAKPGITSSIIGPRTMEQLRDNLGALEIILNDEDHQRLDAVSHPGRVIHPNYEAAFGPHLHRW